MHLTLKRDTTITHATTRRVTGDGFALTVLHAIAGQDRVWIAGHELGPTHIILASSFESAWDEWLDAQPTIHDDEIPEAYGFYGEDGRQRLELAERLAKVREDGWPELVEGYEYQPTATGTGIVDVGHYAWLREATRDDARTLVRLTIGLEGDA